MNQVIDRLLTILIPMSGKYNYTANIIVLWWLSEKEQMISTWTFPGIAPHGVNQ